MDVRIIYKFRLLFWKWILIDFVVCGLAAWVPCGLGVVRGGWQYCLGAHGIGFSLGVLGFVYGEGKYLRMKANLEDAQAQLRADRLKIVSFRRR